MYKRELNSLNRLLAAVLSGAVLLSAGCGGKTEGAGNNSGQQAGAGSSVEASAQSEGAQAGEAVGAAGNSTDSKSDDDESSEASSDATELSEEELDAPIDFTYKNHPMTLVNGYTPYATANYYTIELEKSVKDKFKNLQKVLDEYNKSGEEAVNAFFASSADEIKEMFDSGWGMPYEETRFLYPARADGRVFSYVMGVHTYLAGAHGFMSFEGYNYDPVTGKEIQFSDVVKDTAKLPEIIVSEIEKQHEDVAKSFEELPSDRQSLVDSIPGRLKDNASGLSWAIDYDGIWCNFEDYAMGYYALGAQDVKIKFEDYPEIFTDKYFNYKDKEIPDITEFGRELKEADNVDVDVVPLLSESGAGTSGDKSGQDGTGTDGASSDGAGTGGADLDAKGTGGAGSAENIDKTDGEGEDWWYHAVVKNPGWSEWTNDNADTEPGKPSYELSEVKSNTTDWLNEDKWSEENGIPLPARFPYDNGDYTFSVVNEAEEGKMILTVYNEALSALEGNFYFDEFLNPPDQGEGLFADFTEPEIKYALVENNTLYVSLGHRTYAAANPHTSYIVAIDLVSGETIWRSDDQVCGSSNFVILGDSIYCGYGFTDEPDYIYVLNRFNGKVQKQIKVKSAPYYFIVQEEYMYVLTYNTEYLYKLLD